MFTEGLDESAIQWINQGSQVQLAEPGIHTRSPLTEKVTFPRSPLLSCSANSLTPKSPALPPLKFHTPLLTPTKLAFPFDDDDDGGDSVSDESVVSPSLPGAAQIEGSNFSDDDEEERVVDYLDTSIAHCYNEEQLFGFGSGIKPKPPNHNGILRNGLASQNLTIKLPNNVRRFTDGELGFNKCVQKNLTPCGTAPRGGGIQSHNLNDPVDLTTPSAPPIVVDDLPHSEGSVANEVDQIPQHGSCPSRESLDCDGMRSECSIERNPNTIGERLETTSTQDMERQTPHLQYYNASCNSQFSLQTLITYDACIRLCLQAWARGCTEAPEFLKDECLALRSAFGLHELLLKPRGVKPTEGSSTRNSEQTMPLKMKKVVGKIRVEVKKLRIIQRRKLKSTISQRGSIYIQAGMNYVRHVSSLVKTGINSMKSVSSSVTSEVSH